MVMAKGMNLKLLAEFCIFACDFLIPFFLLFFFFSTFLLKFGVFFGYFEMGLQEFLRKKHRTYGYMDGKKEEGD